MVDFISLKNFNISTMSHLFACTKCKSRHPFEELSKGDQLCKVCRRKFPLVSCSYCRLEFHLLSSSSGSPVCKKCIQYLKNSGQPSCCEYCNIRAAFDGTKCARCSSSEKKYGSPVSCDQCKLGCAFNKPPESMEKVDGKTLCLLCTLSYKRVLHKSKKTTKRHHHSDDKKHKRERRHSHHHSKMPKLDVESGTNMHAMSFSNDRIGSGIRDSPLVLGTYHSTVSDLVETPVSDHMAELTEIKEQVSKLKKQLQQKEQALIEKDKKITEIKADHWEKEKNFRLKLTNTQKDFSERVEALLTENRNLKKQLSSMSKPSKDKPPSSSSSSST